MNTGNPFPKLLSKKLSPGRHHWNHVIVPLSDDVTQHEFLFVAWMWQEDRALCEKLVTFVYSDQNRCPYFMENQHYLTIRTLLAFRATLDASEYENLNAIYKKYKLKLRDMALRDLPRCVSEVQAMYSILARQQVILFSLLAELENKKRTILVKKRRNCYDKLSYSSVEVVADGLKFCEVQEQGTIICRWNEHHIRAGDLFCR